MIGYFKKHIYGRLALLFGLAAAILVSLTYYILFYWAVFDKDNILDVHDAYFHYKFVDSWGSSLDTVAIGQELESLQLMGVIYSIYADTLCTEDYIYNQEIEKELVFWSNMKRPVSLCDYISQQDSKYLEEVHGFKFPEYVSFGDVLVDNNVFPATVIEKAPWQVLLIVEYVYPKEWVTFLPMIVLTVLFMLLLYFMVLYFLRPIGLIKKRIVALEGGDLDAKIKIIGEDELAELSHNINNLIKQIKRLLGQKERLLSDVSHEIRTPLAKIRLLLAMKPKKDKKQQINKQIDYLDSMITNILISDKLSVPYSNLDIKPIEASNLIQQGIDLTKNSNIVVRLPDNPTIYCDVVKLAVVIKNLLDNADKYAPSSSPVVVSCKTEGETVVLQIIDNGPGIPEALMAKIERPFVRGQNLKKSGFGLGLSICKKVIAAHGGTLLIKNNKKSSGCTINIKLNNKNLKKRYLNGKK